MSFGFDKVRKPAKRSERKLDLSGTRMQPPECSGERNALSQKEKRSGLRRVSQRNVNQSTRGITSPSKDSFSISVCSGASIDFG
jgi:hypothetical protein